MDERAMRKAGKRSPSEEELRVSYRYLKSMLDIVIVTDPDGAIRTVNRAGRELLGYSEKELVGWYRMA